VYGMTKGQMAPTTLPKQKTTTTQEGRDVRIHGYPIRVCELLKSLDGVAYLERTSTSTVEGILATKRAIRKAFQYQLADRGFSLVEILATCPTNWKMSPHDSLVWIKQAMEPVYPPGVFKDVPEEKS